LAFQHHTFAAGQRPPFPLPEQLGDTERAHRVVREVSRVVTEAAERAKGVVVGRD